MSYQAAILHSQQHANGSLALNAAVMESLVEEIFFAYALIEGRPEKGFANKTHKCAAILEKHFQKMSLYEQLSYLFKGGLIEKYLYDRANDMRLKRNALMHKGKQVSSRDAADMQTIVRDFWYFLIDRPFELLAPWSYRY